MKTRPLPSRTILKIISIVFVWRVFLFFIGWLAEFVLPYLPTFPYSKAILAQTGWPQWLYSWANFDGVHYLTIIQEGYFYADYIQAFFPTFPVLVRGVSSLGLSPLIAGLLISNLAAIMLAVAWFKFLKQNFDKRQAFIGLLLLLSFPTSFFLGAFYTESIFMLFTILAFYFSLQRGWGLAATFTFLASSTRVVGVLLVPALLIEIYLQENKVNTLPELWQLLKTQNVFSTFKKTVSNQWQQMILVLLGSLGLVAYMIYLKYYFDDALYFFRVQSDFGGFRSTHLVTYPQVIWRSIKILLTNTLNWRYLTYLQEAAAGVLGMGALIYALKSVRLSWVFYSVSLLIIPALTGTFSSLPRYILPAFALYILLIQLLSKRKTLLYGYLAISTILLVINTMLFIRGFWIA